MIPVPLFRCRSRIKVYSQYMDTELYVDRGPPNNKKKVFAFPGFENADELFDITKVETVLKELALLKARLSRLLEIYTACFDWYRGINKIILPSLPCQAKCVPKNKTWVFAAAVTETTGVFFPASNIQPVTAHDKSNNRNPGFVNTESGKPYSHIGGETIYGNQLEFRQFYTTNPSDQKGNEGFSTTDIGFLMYRQGLVYSKCKQPLTPEDFVPELNTEGKRRRQGTLFVLCNGSRHCYKQVQVQNFYDWLPEQVQNFMIGALCKNCAKKANRTDNGGRQQQQYFNPGKPKLGGALLSSEEPKTCYERFVETEPVILETSWDLDSTPLSKLVAVAGEVFPQMMEKLCSGCLLYLTCHHQHHDDDLLFRCLQNSFLKKGTCKTATIEKLVSKPVV